MAATTANEGLVKVTTHCQNCGESDVSRHTTPRLPEPTAAALAASSSGASMGGSFGGSDGGSSSSFGGGAAGGGGAGRSY